MTSRGWGPLRFDWYSICSAHRDSDPNSACRLCRMGCWRHHWSHLFSSSVYRLAPRVWRWWVNR